MGFIEESCAAGGSQVRYEFDIDATRCTGCGLCEAFCPVSVFEMHDISIETPVTGERRTREPKPVYADRCWGCETCVGQCPSHAIHIAGQAATDLFADRARAAPLPADEKTCYEEWADTLKKTLGLRWEPVAVSLIPAGDPVPEVPIPSERMRYCQSLMAARRGRSIMLPAQRHACPDGTSILGLTGIPDKLSSGELYLLFHKLDSMEAARQMVAERPSLPARSIDATVVTPLAQAVCTPDVIAIVAQPEQVMWLCMSASYYTGHRFEFHASGYNAQCVETTLYPYMSGEPNISFGCYGCRASSDVADDLMFMGIPREKMPVVVEGLRELGKKAIPQSRSKLYLPPL
jgi:uncharacterized protein (DUF169 family)/NAD-dependent dihydropyrimidine dehydrogenase PreA subunit